MGSVEVGMVGNQKSVMSPEEAKLVGEYLVLLMERGGKDGYFGGKMGLHDLARISGVQVPYISRIRNGRWKRVGGQIWDKLAKALHTTPGDLMNVGAAETEIADPETVRVPIKDEGGFVYVSQRIMKTVEGKRVLAIRATTDDIGDKIRRGDLLILVVDAEFVNDALYMIYHRDEHTVRRLHMDGNSYLIYGKGAPMRAAVEDVRIEGLFIHCQPEGFSLLPNGHAMADTG